jgi:predicted porin
MNHKVLVLAVATAFAAPLAAVADVKLSGRIQAEYAYAGVGEFDRESFTADSGGTAFNGGPNRIKIDFSESLGGGLQAFGAYASAFNTFTNTGLGGSEEAFVGLRGGVAHIRLGQMNGAYKASKGFVDPFEGTALQARGTAGGMTGSNYLAPVMLKDCTGCSYSALRSQIDDLKADRNINAADYVVTARRSHSPYAALTHSSYVNNTLEVGATFGGFSATLQGFVDKGTGMDGAGLFELKYSAENFTVFASGAYTDLTDNIKVDTIKDGIRGEKEKTGLGNWKVGAQGRFAGFKAGLQYEKAEIGTMTGGEGQYIMGSAEYAMDNVILAAWVARYEDKNLDDEDALSFSIGAKYKFSKRTHAHLGYRQTNSKNDFRDEDVFALGVKHMF